MTIEDASAEEIQPEYPDVEELLEPREHSWKVKALLLFVSILVILGALSIAISAFLSMF